MKLRIFQTFVCFILICCLIFACSPIQAEAVAISGSAVAIGVGIGLAVAAGFQALGIRQGTDGAAFSSLVSECTAALSPEWAIDGLTTMLALTTDGVTKTYASQGFLQAILDWLFGNDIVIEGASLIPAGTTITLITGDTIVADQNCYVIEYVYESHDYSGHHKNLVVSETNKNLTYYLNGSNELLQGTYQQADLGGYRVATFSIYYPDVRNIRPDLPRLTYNEYTYYDTRAAIRLLEQGYFGGFASSFDLNLESVGQDIDTDYETYVDESIISVDFGIQFEDDPNTGRNEEDNNKVGWVPTRLLTSTGDTYADQTQADAQSGLTDPEIVEGFNNNSGGGSDSGTSSDIFSSIKDFFTLSSDPAAWAIDLREFFPFCIPYDIYDFLSILAAEPEAPVFEWVIPVPQLGQTFELEVDLSAWDGVARLFRNLELLAFIVGLAYVTREKFIRG